MKALLDANLVSLNHLADVLRKIDFADYQQKLAVLNNSSIGMHFRHVLEFYDLLLQSESELCYDDRPRRYSIENNTEEALDFLVSIKTRLEGLHEDRNLILSAGYDAYADTKTQVKSTLSRELAYNLEHCIHHMALIRIGLQQLDANWDLPDSFGIAPSTLRAMRLSSTGS
jgi:uncharacterized damage-inducible protein DinB